MCETMDLSLSVAMVNGGRVFLGGLRRWRRWRRRDDLSGMLSGVWGKLRRCWAEALAIDLGAAGS